MDIWNIFALKHLRRLKVPSWREPIKVLADLLSRELSLGADRIFIYNDGRPLPKDKGLYIVLSINGTNVIRNTSVTKDVTVNEQSVYTEVLDQNFKQNIIVSVISEDSSARLMANEVVMALSSVYSQQLQEKYSCHIARIAHITDASFLEKTDMLTRMDVAVSVLSWKQLVKPVDYYEVEDFESMFEA